MDGSMRETQLNPNDPIDRYIQNWPQDSQEALFLFLVCFFPLSFFKNQHCLFEAIHLPSLLPFPPNCTAQPRAWWGRTASCAVWRSCRRSVAVRSASRRRTAPIRHTAELLRRPSAVWRRTARLSGTEQIAVDGHVECADAEPRDEAEHVRQLATDGRDAQLALRCSACPWDGGRFSVWSRTKPSKSEQPTEEPVWRCAPTQHGRRISFWRSTEPNESSRANEEPIWRRTHTGDGRQLAI